MLLLLPNRRASGLLLFAVLALVINFALASVIYALSLGTHTFSSARPVSLSPVYMRADPGPEQEAEDVVVELSSAPQSSAPPPPMALNLTTISVDSQVVLPLSMPDIKQQSQVLPTISMQFSANGTMPGSQMMTSISTAKPVFQIPPQYPIRAKQRGIEGYIVLDMKITPQGRAEQVKIVKQEPENIFARSAKRAVMRWRFAAPKVTEWQRITIRYELEN